jgi:fibronectin-binding autotransporter adhesin
MKRNLALLSFLAVSASSQLTAATATWDGSFSINWNGDDTISDSNWAGGAGTFGKPIAGDDLIFTGAIGTTNTNDLTAGTSIQSITFDSLASAFTIGGNQITLLGGLTNNSGVLQTLNTAIATTTNNAVNTGAGGLVLGGVVSGTGGITKTGAGILTLSALNSFTGNLTINEGTVLANVSNNTLTNVVVAPNTSALGAPNTAHDVNVNNGGTLQFGTANVLGTNSNINILTRLVVNTGGQVASSSGVSNTLGAISLNGGTITANSGSSATSQGFYLRQTVTVGGSSASTMASTGTANSGFNLVSGAGTNFNVTDATGSTASDLVISAPLVNTATGALGGMTKSGAGTLELSGSNRFGGIATVTDGTLKLTGSMTGYEGTNTNLAVGNLGIAVSPASGGTSTVLVSGGSFTGGANVANNASIAVGNNAGGTGVLTMTGGSVISGGNATQRDITAGRAGHGIVNVSGGSMTVGGYLVGGINASGAVGVWNISGGSVGISTFGTTNFGATLGASAGTAGVMNITGGSFTSATTGTAGGMFLGENATGSGILNVSGLGTGTFGGGSTSLGLRVGNNNVATNTGIVNLGAVGSGGGTIVATKVSSAGTTSNSYFNFHGGTLKASTAAAGATFFTGLKGAYVYGEGGTIDNNGVAVTVGQALLAPTGQKASSISAAASGFASAGYTAAPNVVITGGTGTGMTANAIVDSAGNLTGFTITNPGTGYANTDTVTVTLSGGGKNTTSASTSAISFAGNTSGGMTLTGSAAGITTLSGASTFSGDLSITGGTKVIANLANNVNNPTNSALGNNQVSRNITLSGGSTLQFNQGDVMGSATSTLASTLVIGAGSTVTNGGGVFNRLGSVVLNGGTLTAVSGAVAGYEAYSFGSNSVVTVGGTSVSTISSPGSNGGIHLGADTSFDVSDSTSSSASDLNVSARLINQNNSEGNAAGGLTKTGVGTMTLTGSNGYTGATTVATGKLILGAGGSIANSSTINVQAGATLDASALGGWSVGTGQTVVGHGTLDVGAGNSFIVGPGATLAAGSSPGTLTVIGTLDLGESSTFAAELATAGVTSDQIIVSGDFNVNASALLALSLFGSDVALAEGTKFTLVDYDGSWNNVSFSGLEDDTNVTLGMNTYNANYNDGSAFTLTVVPEPSAALLGGFGLLGLLRRRRSA